MGSKLCVLVIVPHNSSMIRRALASVGSLRSGSPASTVLWLAPTPCRPSRRTSFPSLGGTVPCPSRMTRSVGTPPSSGFGKPVPNRQRHTETTGSPRFLGSPLGYMPCSKTPVGRSHRGMVRHLPQFGIRLPKGAARSKRLLEGLRPCAGSPQSNRADARRATGVHEPALVAGDLVRTKRYRSASTGSGLPDLPLDQGVFAIDYVDELGWFTPTHRAAQIDVVLAGRRPDAKRAVSQHRRDLA